MHATHATYTNDKIARDKKRLHTVLATLKCYLHSNQCAAWADYIKIRKPFAFTVVFYFLPGEMEEPKAANVRDLKN